MASLERTVALNIRAAMKRKRWTHVMTADHAAVALSTLNYLLAEHGSPTLDTVHRIASALGTTAADLMRHE